MADTEIEQINETDLSKYIFNVSFYYYFIYIFTYTYLI